MKKYVSLAVAFLVFSLSVLYPASSENDLASSAFVQGADAFRSGDWISSLFLLRKAVSYPENFNAETYYMLISAEMYAGEYKNAFHDCELYLKSFSGSAYEPYIIYHKGRALYYLGEYDKSVIVMSDFCHQHPEHEMYASALFWIAESFYSAGSYDEAELLYARILHDFPNDAKAPAAQYRIESIAQSLREEKLIYLLKQTGEEYLAAKEEYERQLLLSSSESSAQMRSRLLDLQQENAGLEKKVSELSEELEKARAAQANETLELLEKLKAKAQETQKILDSRTQRGGAK
ncbi:MAG: tetratricopeptide repeat protein [Treponema sp.]